MEATDGPQVPSGGGSGGKDGVGGQGVALADGAETASGGRSGLRGVRFDRASTTSVDDVKVESVKKQHPPTEYTLPVPPASEMYSRKAPNLPMPPLPTATYGGV